MHACDGGAAVADALDPFGDAGESVEVVQAGVEARGGILDVLGDVGGRGRELGLPAWSAGCFGHGGAGSDEGLGG